MDANGEKVVVVVVGFDWRTESDPLAIFSHFALCPEILTLSTALSRLPAGLGQWEALAGDWRMEERERLMDLFP